MASASVNPNRLAHELINRLTPNQAESAVQVLMKLLSPMERALLLASVDEEEESREEFLEAAESRAALERGMFAGHEEVLAELGLTSDDFERMAESPVEQGFIPIKH